MKGARELALADTVAVRVASAHDAVTAVGPSQGVFGGATRTVTQPDVFGIDAKSSDMTSVWRSASREPQPTEVLALPPTAANATTQRSTVVKQPRTHWRPWGVAVVLVGVLSVATPALLSQPVGARVPARSPSPLASTPATKQTKPSGHAPLTDAERARQEAVAAAAVIAGDHMLALQRYRTLAAATQDPAFEHVVRILERSR